MTHATTHATARPTARSLRRGLVVAVAPLLVGAAASGVLALAAGAQSPLPPAGSRVRIRHDPHPDRWLTGVLQPAGPDTVALDNGRGRWVAVVPAATVRRMEVSRGLESGRQATARGALWGGAIGAVGGALAGGFGETCELDGDIQRCESAASQGHRVAARAAAGAIAGAVVGALVARRHRRERWEPVALPLRIGVGAGRRGTVVGLAGAHSF